MQEKICEVIASQRAEKRSTFIEHTNRRACEFPTRCKVSLLSKHNFYTKPFLIACKLVLCKCNKVAVDELLEKYRKYAWDVIWVFWVVHLHMCWKLRGIQFQYQRGIWRRRRVKLQKSAKIWVDSLSLERAVVCILLLNERQTFDTEKKKHTLGVITPERWSYGSVCANKQTQLNFLPNWIKRNSIIARF